MRAGESDYPVLFHPAWGRGEKEIPWRLGFRYEVTRVLLLCWGVPRPPALGIRPPYGRNCARNPARTSAASASRSGPAGNLMYFGDVDGLVAPAAVDGRELLRINLGGQINVRPISFAIDGHRRAAILAGNTVYLFRP